MLTELSTTTSVALVIACDAFCMLDRHRQLVSIRYPAQQDDGVSHAILLEPLRAARLPGTLQLIIQNQQLHDLQLHHRTLCSERILTKQRSEEHTSELQSLMRIS